MDRLFSTCEGQPASVGRHVTGVAALTEFGENVKLSRSHLTRKLREAELQGALGWSSARGRSPIWISSAFVAEYLRRQSAELAVIEVGFHAAFAAAST